MILTVTPNTALDRILFLESLQRDTRNEATGSRISVGGKGCVVALLLSELGEESVATGLAAGEAGRQLEALMRGGGVTPDFVWTGGETRVNTVILEQQGDHHTSLCADSLQPDDHALSALLAWIEKWSPQAEAVVLSGSLPAAWPPEVYRELVRASRSGGRPVVVDASGAALEAALSAGVAAIKPNRRELESVCGPVSTDGELIAAARKLRDRGAGRVLVSLGAEGALMVSDQVLRADALEVPVVNPAGAGDGMAAMLALGLARGWSDEEILRQAVAVSAAVVAAPGTSEIRRELVQPLMGQVRIRAL